MLLIGGECAGHALAVVSIGLLVASLAIDELAVGYVSHTDVRYVCGWHHATVSSDDVEISWRTRKHTRTLAEVAFIFTLATLILQCCSFLFLCMNQAYLCKYIYICGLITLCVAFSVWTFDRRGNDCLRSKLIVHPEYGMSIYLMCVSLIISTVGATALIIGEWHYRRRLTDVHVRGQSVGSSSSQDSSSDPIIRRMSQTYHDRLKQPMLYSRIPQPRPSNIPPPEYYRYHVAEDNAEPQQVEIREIDIHQIHNAPVNNKRRRQSLESLDSRLLIPESLEEEEQNADTYLNLDHDVEPL